jgi:formylglycine-generating enzyme required for sulfatase activity
MIELDLVSVPGRAIQQGHSIESMKAAWHRHANLAEAGNSRPTKVGSFPDGASADGVLDLAGNVDEWTATVYEP